MVVSRLGWRDYLQLFTNRRIAVTLLLGFSSGLPLALTGSTLQAWFTVSGVNIVTIGFLGLVGQPYIYKFLWAPLMDRYVPPLLGRRRGWLLLTQAGLLVTIIAMGTLSPAVTPWHLGLLALAVAFLSASQDIVIDAYRTDLLRPAERGLGAAAVVGGYRVAMLVSGGVALIMSEWLGWRATYTLMGVLMAVGILATLIGPEPERQVVPPRTLADAVWKPFWEFITRPGAAGLLLMIVLYKFGDAFAGTLTTAFLIRGAGFSPADVGAIYKSLGLFATLLGIFLGGTLMAELGLFRSLLWFGILQGVSNLSFVALAAAGKSYPLMVFAVTLENFTAGMGTAAFVAMLMALCDARYTATQYALLSALSAVGRVFLGPPAGYLVESLGWGKFFFVTFIAALPGLGLLWLLRRRVEDLNGTTAARQE